MSTMIIAPYKPSPRYRLGWNNAAGYEYKLPYDLELLGDIYLFLGLKVTYPLQNEKRIIDATRQKFNLPSDTPDEKTIQILQQEMLRKELKSAFGIEGSTYEEVVQAAIEELDIPRGKNYVETRDILWGKVLDYYMGLDEWSHDMSTGSHHN